MASIVKLAFGGDTRRLPAATATSISAVHAHAAALFGVAAPVLTYVDEDGDAITITTDAELTAALSEAGKALKITVKLAPQGARSSRAGTRRVGCQRAAHVVAWGVTGL